MGGLLVVTGSVAHRVMGGLSQSLCLELLLKFLTSQSNKYKEMQMTTKEMLIGREGKWPLRYKICDHKEMKNNYRELSLIWRLLVLYKVYKVFANTSAD